jgi:RNA polymerase primary sigma factor
MDVETTTTDQVKTFNLSPYQSAEVKAILTPDNDNILPIGDPSVFADTEKMKEFMGTKIPEPSTAWYASFVNEMGGKGTSSVSAVLSHANESALFHQFNYSRSRLAGLVKAGISTKVQALRAIIWNRRVNKYREKLTGHNLALVLSIVKKFHGSNLDFDEMLSEGNVILLNAINKFDATKGFKFSTYVTWSVERAFGKASHKKSRGNSMFPVSLDLELQKSDYVDRKREGAVSDSVLTLREIIKNNAAGLDDVELAIIKARYPADAPADFEKPTLEEIGKKLDRNKSNMSRKEKSALAKLQEAFKKQLG